MEHKKITDEKSLNDAFIQMSQMGSNECDIYIRSTNGEIILWDASKNVVPCANKVSLEWIQGYLWAKNPFPSRFRQMYERTGWSNPGSFDKGLYDLFILAGEGNRKSLIKAFPEMFNPGDEKLEW